MVLLATLVLPCGCGDDAAPSAPAADKDRAPGAASGGSAVEVAAQSHVIERLASAGADGAIANAVGGTVLGPDGSPLVGAEVVLLRLVTPWPEQRAVEVARVFSGQDGHFRFATPRDEDLAIEVIHKNLARERVPAPPALESLTIRLAHGFEVSGVVRFGQTELKGHGTRVILEPGGTGTRRAVETATDDAGRFEFDNVPAGPARLTVQFQGLAPTTMNSLVVGGEPVNVSLVPEAALPIVGRVTSAGDGHPIARAEVRAYPTTAWNALLYQPVVATTAEDGTFQLVQLGQGPNLLVVSHPEFSSTTRAVALGSGPPQQEFELARRGELALRLSGVAKAGIELRLVSSAGEILRATVDESGRARFAPLMSIGPAKVEVIGGSCAFAKSLGREVDVNVEEGAGHEVVLETIDPSALMGRVLDDAGKPLAGVLVSVPRHRFERRNPERWSVATGADGRFVMRGLPPASAQLTFDLEGFASSDVGVNVEGAGRRQDVGDVVMVRPGTIAGVVMRTGKAVAGASVFATREGEAASHAVSAPDGTYRLLGLSPGRYRVMARSGSLPLQVHGDLVVVASGEQTAGIDFEVPRGRRISGRVLTPRAEPVADAMVCVLGVTASIGTTDQGGRFELQVPEGQVELQAFSPDFRSTGDEVVGPTQDVVTIRVPWITQGSFEGVIAPGLRGRVPPRVIVGISPLGDDFDPSTRALRSKRVVTDVLPGGLVRVDQLPAGEAMIEILAPGLGPWRQRVTIPERRTLRVDDITLDPGAELSGRVLDRAGRPVVGAVVHLGAADDLDLDLAHSNLTDRDGRFSVHGVTADSRQLVVAADGFMMSSRQIVIPDDLLGVEPYTVTLDPTAMVRVQLTKGGKAAAAFRLLSVRRDGEFLGNRITDVEGRLGYVVDRPGVYRFSLFGELEERSVDVVVGPGGSAQDVALAID